MAMPVHKRYLAFATVYTAYTVYAFYRAYTVPSITIGVMFMLCLLWLAGAVALSGIMFLSRKTDHTPYDYMVLVFCTPIPTWVILALLAMFS